VKAKHYLIKATMKDGRSYNTPTITYKIGIVSHPNPDRKSADSCGVGIHLAKTLRSAKHFVPKAEEFYFAEPGVILGEDSEKVRCASCRIVRRLTPADIKRLEKIELTKEELIRQEEQARGEKLQKEAEARRQLGDLVFNTGGLPGKDWLINHSGDVTMEDINSQTLEIFRGDKKVMSIKPVAKRKDARYAIRTALA
jgi:hypothetical protein